MNWFFQQLGLKFGVLLLLRACSTTTTSTCDTNFSCILSTRVVWRRIAACGGGDLDIHIGVRGVWVGYGGRQEQRTGDTCGRIHRVRRRGDHHDLRCGSHLRRSHEPCCYYCLRNRQTLPLVTGTIQCESWSLWTFGQGEMLWRHDLVKPRELLLSGHFTPSTLTKAKCPDDKTLLHLERSCYGGHFTPWTLTKAKCSHDRQDLVKAGEVLPWGHSPWPRCRGAKAKCPDGKTSGPLYLIFSLLHLGVQRCVEL